MSRFLKLTASGATDVGQVRQHNEDCVLVRADMNLFILADGAGGHNAGNVASALATTCVAKAYESPATVIAEGPAIEEHLGPAAARRLAVAIQKANRDIVDIAKSSNKYRGMGTTVVAAAFSPESGGLHVAHVGDSRCYRLRGGFLEQLTSDHSLLNDVLELRPDIDDLALSRLPKNVVTRALGMDEDVRVAVKTHRVAPGDRYVLCSDGLTDALDDDTIGETLGQQKSADDLVRALIDAALFVGADDNVGVVVIACDASETESIPPPRRVAKPKRPRVDVPPPMRPQYGSAPEIIIVDVEHEGDENAPIHVVPAESATASLLDAFAGLRKRHKPPPSAG